MSFAKKVSHTSFNINMHLIIEFDDFIFDILQRCKRDSLWPLPFIFILPIGTVSQIGILCVTFLKALSVTPININLNINHTGPKYLENIVKIFLGNIVTILLYPQRK